MRGQLEEARKRREAEKRELDRRLHLSRAANGAEVPLRRIVVVGPCASGKSLLVNTLREHGYNAHASAQEHSYVPTMWMMTNPSHLIYLDVDLPSILQRRRVAWGQAYLDEENVRLANARQSADLIIDTAGLAPEEVIKKAMQFLKAENL